MQKLFLRVESSSLLVLSKSLNLCLSYIYFLKLFFTLNIVLSPACSYEKIFKRTVQLVLLAIIFNGLQYFSVYKYLDIFLATITRGKTYRRGE